MLRCSVMPLTNAVSTNRSPQSKPPNGSHDIAASLIQSDLARLSTCTCLLVGKVGMFLPDIGCQNQKAINPYGRSAFRGYVPRPVSWLFRDPPALHGRPTDSRSATNPGDTRRLGTAGRSPSVTMRDARRSLTGNGCDLSVSGCVAGPVGGRQQFISTLNRRTTIGSNP